MIPSLPSVRAACLMCLCGVGVDSTVVAQSMGESPAFLRRSTMPGVVLDAWFQTEPVGFQTSMPVVSSVRSERVVTTLAPQHGWPSPVNDRKRYVFALVDVFEYRPSSDAGQSRDDYRWDIEGWYGGDYNRLWFKSEGQQDTAFKADYDVDVQLLYGRFIWKYYDLQIGSRVETQAFRGRNVTRGLGVIGIQGLVPYNYELEASLFIDQGGKVSGRLSFTKDFLLTQRLILQGRVETNVAAQRAERFTTGSGLNNLEFGIRIRYEIRREFAPYVGISLDRSFSETAALVREEGGNPSQIRFVAGVRAWF